MLTKAFVEYVRPFLFTYLLFGPVPLLLIIWRKGGALTLKLSYETRLRLLALEQLEIRRLHADFTMCYKIVRSLVNIPFDYFF